MTSKQRKTGVREERVNSGHYASADRVVAYLKNGGTMTSNLVLDLENNRFRKVA